MVILYETFVFLCDIHIEKFTDHKHIIQWINSHTGQEIEHRKNPRSSEGGKHISVGNI